MADQNSTDDRFREGELLAINMLAEIEGCDGCEGDEFGRYARDAVSHFEGGEPALNRTGPQDNIVARHVLAMQGDPEMIRGFGAVLSDFLAWSAAGCVPTLDEYEREAT